MEQGSRGRGFAHLFELLQEVFFEPLSSALEVVSFTLVFRRDLSEGVLNPDLVEVCDVTVLQ